MKKIILTGGGSAGHVTPNLALAAVLTKEQWQIEYIGSRGGIEKNLVEEAGLPFYPIASGKLRRHFSLENFIDPFKVLLGIFQASFLVRKLKPQMIFSKGGFVTVPVIIAGYLNKVPVIIHESDMTPGLANKIAIRFAKKVCASFPETLKYLPAEKRVYTGAPIREEISRGNREKGLAFCGFSSDLPVLLVIGGSLGSAFINSSVREILPRLTEKFQLVHVCGKDNIQTGLDSERYKQYEFIGSELPDVLAAADIVVSRAGSNAVFEFLALKKPNLLIPLSRKASRGDQILNAESFEKSGFSAVLPEEKLTPDLLYSSVITLFADKNKYISNMEKSTAKNSIGEIYDLIKTYASGKISPSVN